MNIIEPIVQHALDPPVYRDMLQTAIRSRAIRNRAQRIRRVALGF